MPPALPATPDPFPRGLIVDAVVSGGEAHAGEASGRCQHGLGIAYSFRSGGSAVAGRNS
jgi:hypothetical protein